ncbi:MAG: hypothetical protein AB1592_10615 [Pseudomonadota bacterium]
MSRIQPYLFPILGIAAVNGIFSPLVLPVAILMAPFLPGFFTSSVSVLFFLTSLVVSTCTIMVAGVPAALFERLTGRKETDEVTMWIWLAGTALISMPAVSRFFSIGF